MEKLLLCGLAYLLSFYVLLLLLRGAIQWTKGEYSVENAEIIHIFSSLKHQFDVLNKQFLKRLNLRKGEWESTEDVYQRDLERISDDLLILYHQYKQFVKANREKISPLYLKNISLYLQTLETYLLTWTQLPENILLAEEQKIKNLSQRIYQLWI